MSKLSSADGSLQDWCKKQYAMLEKSQKNLAQAVEKSKMRQKINDLEDKLETIEERSGMAYVANLRAKKRLTDQIERLQKEVRDLRAWKRERQNDDEDRQTRLRVEYERKEAVKRQRREAEDEDPDAAYERMQAVKRHRC